MLNKASNFKIIITFNEEFIFLFCELCKRVHNTFMLKIESFTVYFKIMLFWITSWTFKKVLYDIALTYNYSMSIVIFWWCFCNAWLFYLDKRLDLDDAAMTQIVRGTTKSLLFFFMSSFSSSVFSIYDRSKVDVNCFTTTLYSLKSLQEPYFKIQITKTGRGRCFEFLWAKCKQDNLEVFWFNSGFVTWRAFFSSWFCQLLRINFNKFVCFPSKFIR